MSLASSKPPVAFHLITLTMPHSRHYHQRYESEFGLVFVAVIINETLNHNKTVDKLYNRQCLWVLEAIDTALLLTSFKTHVQSPV